MIDALILQKTIEQLHADICNAVTAACGDIRPKVELSVWQYHTPNFKLRIVTYGTPSVEASGTDVAAVLDEFIRRVTFEQAQFGIVPHTLAEDCHTERQTYGDWGTASWEEDRRNR